MRRNRKLALTFVLLGTIAWVFFCESQKEKPFTRLAGETPLIHGLKDTVGFSFSPEQIQQVVNLSEGLEKEAFQVNAKKFGLDESARWIAAVCPHDDHLLAGRVYVHVFQHLRAKRIVIFGVAHRAQQWGVEDKIIFDSFDFWRGPYSDVKVSSIRDEIVRQLPGEYFTVSNDFQSEEHSVEGIVPFIQHYIRDAEIVSILVPYMDWPRIEEISEHLSTALVNIISKNDWRLGDDIAFICSNDGDHYGDQDWGGRDLAPFGADECGHRIQTAQDSLLAESTLAGTLSSDKLESFCRQVWGEDDLKTYKIRWCGRFSVPFGLNCVRQVVQKLGLQELHGFLLRYDTSYRLGKLPLPNIGIGTTAPNNIHHWVGYSAIGYK